MNLLFFLLMMAMALIVFWAVGGPCRYRARTRRALGGVLSVLMLLLVVLPMIVQAGEVAVRRADTWTNSAGTNITAGLWESWDIDKIEFYGLNPTNTAITISVKYAVGGYTQTVGSVTGSASGTATFTTNFPVVTGDVLLYTADASSTGKVVTTYLKYNP